MIEYPHINRKDNMEDKQTFLQLLIMLRSIRNIYQDKPNGIVFVDIGQVSKATH